MMDYSQGYNQQFFAEQRLKYPSLGGANLEGLTDPLNVENESAMIKQTLIESGMSEAEASAVLAEQLKLVQEREFEQIQHMDVQPVQGNNVPERVHIAEAQKYKIVNVFQIANVIDDYFAKPQNQPSQAQRSAALREKMESTNAKMQ